MIGPQRILANHQNAIRSAILSASTFKAGEAPRAIDIQRTGRGSMSLTGNSTQAVDRVIEVQVLSGAGSTLSATTPVNVGVGNGTMTVNSLDVSAVPETLTFSLSDTGIAEAYAVLDFFGVTLQAKTVGAAGNALKIDVTRNLTLSDAIGATLAERPAGSDVLPDARWDFGAKTSIDGQVPADALRLKFGEYQTIHRHWKVWENNAWIYRIDPALPFTIPAETPVYEVTGNYTLTISDGVTSEPYSAITLYDFLSQLDTSNLVNVVGVVSADRQAGGQGISEIPLRTDAYLQPTIAEISGQYGSQSLDSLALTNPAAVTENIVIQRLKGTNDARAPWSVKGGASGDLGRAYAGTAFSSGPLSFTIPAATVPEQGRGELAVQVRYASQSEGGSPAQICVKNLTLGAAFTPKTVTFIYTKRPTYACECESMSAPTIPGECLGIDNKNEGGSMSWSPEALPRAQSLYTWRATWLESQRRFFESPGYYAAGDLTATNRVTEALAQALRDGCADVVAGADAWDSAFSSIQAAFAADLSGLEDERSSYIDSLVAEVDAVYPAAGLDPKGNASSGSVEDGDCWQDPGDAFYWADEGEYYLPAFTNRAYVSSRQCSKGAQSTQEFGFAVMVDCTEHLKEGDRFTLTLTGGPTSAYAEGDKFTVPIVAGQSANFSGGVDGNPTHTWSVSGSVSGALSSWLWNPENPTDYTGPPVNVSLLQGGIAFERGDIVRLDIEGGQMRWRNKNGAWNTLELFDADHDLGDGLTLNAIKGASPSFVPGDRWTFLARANYGPDALRAPVEGEAFVFELDACTIDADFGQVQELDALLLGMHTIPDGAIITLSGGISANNEWTELIPWRKQLIFQPIERSARYVRVSISGTGAGAEIGWLWLGQSWKAQACASSIEHVHQYSIVRGQGRNPQALYRGRGTGGRWEWNADQGGALFADELNALIALFDHVAQNDMQWVCLAPNIEKPETATLAQVDFDQVAFVEHLGFYLDDQPAHSVELPFRAVVL